MTVSMDVELIKKRSEALYPQLKAAGQQKWLSKLDNATVLHDQIPAV